MSNRNGLPKMNSSRFADAYQTTTLSPAAMACPCSVVSRVAVRRKSKN